MADGELVDLSARRKRARGSYVVGPRIRAAIEALASGKVRTIQAAAEVAQMSREGLSKALARENVKGYLRERIQEELGVGASRASRKVLELMENAQNSMVQLGAAKFLLATGAGIVPPSPPGTTVNIGIATQPVGYCIDLQEADDVDDSRVIRAAPGPLIEGEVVAPADVAKRSGE